MVGSKGEVMDGMSDSRTGGQRFKIYPLADINSVPPYDQKQKDLRGNTLYEI